MIKYAPKLAFLEVAIRCSYVDLYYWNGSKFEFILYPHVTWDYDHSSVLGRLKPFGNTNLTDADHSYNNPNTGFDGDLHDFYDPFAWLEDDLHGGGGGGGTPNTDSNAIKNVKFSPLRLRHEFIDRMLSYMTTGNFMDRNGSRYIELESTMSEDSLGEYTPEEIKLIKAYVGDAKYDNAKVFFVPCKTVWVRLTNINLYSDGTVIGHPDGLFDTVDDGNNEGTVVPQSKKNDSLFLGGMLLLSVMKL